MEIHRRIFPLYCSMELCVFKSFHVLSSDFNTQVVDLLAQGSKSIFSGAINHYASLCQEAELPFLGSFGMTSYHCTNFVSCMHRDRDAGKGKILHPCFQLIKENCSNLDFNFAYVEWGIVIETRANSLWCVFGRVVSALLNHLTVL